MPMPYQLGYELYPVPGAFTIPPFDGLNRYFTITVDGPLDKYIVSSSYQFVPNDPEGLELEVFPQITINRFNGNQQWIFQFVKDDIKSFNVNFLLIVVNPG